MILLAGGSTDPNILALEDRLRQRNVPHGCVLGRKGQPPRFRWSLASDRLTLDGREARPSGVFVRFDVFAEMQDGRPSSRREAAEWYYAVLSWALVHSGVALFNRSFGTSHLAKPYVLVEAQRAGLEIAETMVTNDPAALGGLDADKWIVKPVDGGAHTVTLRTVCGEADRLEAFLRAPAFLQRRLVQPDLRIYRVGATWFAFVLRGDAVDFRVAKRLEVEQAEPDPRLVEPLEVLTDRLGLDFAAADFKLCPDTGRFRFLEVNSAPMFAGFDRHANGAIADTIIDMLSKQSQR